MDTTAATTAIAAAQTGLLAIVGALTTLAIAVWGARKLATFFGGGK